jgi:hypothetical protein
MHPIATRAAQRLIVKFSTPAAKYSRPSVTPMRAEADPWVVVTPKKL